MQNAAPQLFPQGPATGISPSLDEMMGDRLLGAAPTELPPRPNGSTLAGASAQLPRQGRRLQVLLGEIGKKFELEPAAEDLLLKVTSGSPLIESRVLTSLLDD